MYSSWCNIFFHSLILLLHQSRYVYHSLRLVKSKHFSLYSFWSILLNHSCPIFIEGWQVDRFCCSNMLKPWILKAWSFMSMAGRRLQEFFKYKLKKKLFNFLSDSTRPLPSSLLQCSTVTFSLLQLLHFYILNFEQNEALHIFHKNLSLTYHSLGIRAVELSLVYRLPIDLAIGLSIQGSFYIYPRFWTPIFLGLCIYKLRLVLFP